MANNTNKKRLKIKARATLQTGTDKRPRMVVYKSNKRIYAQLINDLHQKTLTSVSSISIDKEKNATIEIAKKTGELIGTKAKDMGVNDIIFDRSGYPYHGQVKALADGARSKGLKF